MLAVPDRTQYDLSFNLLGFPTRVHPLFWLMAVVIGWQVGDMRARLIWVGCVFVSILVHELGHAVVARLTGAYPSIVLHMMGGLCVYDPIRQSLWQRLAVLICGPGAGFVLAAIVAGAGWATFGLTLGDYLALLGWRLESVSVSPALAPFILGDPSPRLLIVAFLVEINVLWGVLNLLPIFPLDGGQITHAILSAVNPGRGFAWAHMISVAVGGIMALRGLADGNQMQALMFAWFAGFNLKVLLDLRQGVRGGYGQPDSADWWKR